MVAGWLAPFIHLFARSFVRSLLLLLPWILSANRRINCILSMGPWAFRTTLTEIRYCQPAHSFTFVVALFGHIQRLTKMSNVYIYIYVCM